MQNVFVEKRVTELRFEPTSGSHNCALFTHALHCSHNFYCEDEHITFLTVFDLQKNGNFI